MTRRVIVNTINPLYIILLLLLLSSPFFTTPFLFGLNPWKSKHRNRTLTHFLQLQRWRSLPEFITPSFTSNFGIFIFLPLFFLEKAEILPPQTTPSYLILGDYPLRGIFTLTLTLPITRFNMSPVSNPVQLIGNNRSPLRLVDKVFTYFGGGVVGGWILRSYSVLGGTRFAYLA